MRKKTLLSKLRSIFPRNKGRVDTRPEPLSSGGMQAFSLTAKQQLQALESGQISAADLLEQTIARAEEIAPTLNPIALKLYGRARQAAQEADKARAAGRAGKLCGLPITIKDSQFLAGYPCANGALVLSDFVPTETCRAVELLEQEGAVIFAKTTCPEFSLTGVTHSEIYGLTSNPRDTGRTCGGSSGGASTPSTRASRPRSAKRTSGSRSCT